MAEQKLSARQKMINMMYLVLTAMLALNVTSEILLAFESLSDSLDQKALTAAANNNNLATDISSVVDKELEDGKDKHLYLKNIISDVNKETNSMLVELETIKSDLREIGGIDPETNRIDRKDEVDKNYRYWMGANDMANGGHGEGKAREMRAKLEEFVTWANEIYEKYSKDKTKGKFSSLVLEPKDDPRIADPESKDKSWEYHTFHNSPVVANMAMVNKFKTDVLDIQTSLLNMTKNLLDDYIFQIDSLIAFEAPSATMVAAGMKYETKLIVGVSAKGFTPEFVGSGIRTDEGGSTATMTIPASASAIPAGKNEGIQRYTAKIKVPTAEGTMKELTVNGEFKVRRPEVVVRSKALQLLYKDCGNTVTVDVPALGDQYNPDFAGSSGGQIIKGSSSKDITIVPTARNFQLKVASNTNGQRIDIDKLQYNVVEPPKPRLALFYNGREVNAAQAMSKRMTVTLKLLPDEEFAKTLPRDARYLGTKVKLMVKNSLGPPTVVKEYSGRDLQKGVQISLYQGAIRNAHPGATIFVEVEEVKRVNFQNRQLDARLTRGEKILSMNLRD